MSNVTSIRPAEIITAIEETEREFDELPDTTYQVPYQGYKITTTQQEILLLIEADQQCCEVWGYLMSEDNLDEFIGATLLGLRVVDTDGKTAGTAKASHPDNEEDWTDDDEDDDGRFDNAMFVNIETDRGTLQFTAYNNHNGYYGHTARVVSKQLNYQENL